MGYHVSINARKQPCAPTACPMTTVEPAAPITQCPRYWDGFKVLPPLNMPQQHPPALSLEVCRSFNAVSPGVVTPTFARTAGGPHGVLNYPPPTASPRRLGVGQPGVTEEPTTTVAPLSPVPGSEQV